MARLVLTLAVEIDDNRRDSRNRLRVQLRGRFLLTTILEAAIAVVEVALFVVGAALMTKFTSPATVALFAMTSDRAF